MYLLKMYLLKINKDKKIGLWRGLNCNIEKKISNSYADNIFLIIN